MRILLIAGLWLDGSAWQEVVPALEAQGHRPVPLTLPGQGDGAASATLEDQVAAVLAAVDAEDDRVTVVGHSAACTLAWLAADRRPEKVAGVALIGGFPSADGEQYAAFFERKDGVMPFPGWEKFEGPDSDDMSEQLKADLLARMIPVPVGVTRGEVHWTSEARKDVPLTLVCPEFSPAEAQEWIDDGDVPEFSTANRLELVDIDSGHWPMFTQPAALATLLDKASRR